MTSETTVETIEVRATVTRGEAFGYWLKLGFISFGLGIAAALALFRFKLGVIPMVLRSAVAGLAWQFAHAAISTNL